MARRVSWERDLQIVSQQEIGYTNWKSANSQIVGVKQRDGDIDSATLDTALLCKGGQKGPKKGPKQCRISRLESPFM